MRTLSGQTDGQEKIFVLKEVPSNLGTDSNSLKYTAVNCELQQQKQKQQQQHQMAWPESFDLRMMEKTRRIYHHQPPQASFAAQAIFGYVV